MDNNTAHRQTLPIPLSHDTLRAILDGRKTQARWPTSEKTAEELNRGWEVSAPLTPGDLLYAHDAACAWLRVRSIGVARVQSISAFEIAHREGVTPDENYRTNSELVTLFSSLWNKIHSSNGFGWDANPWVWVIEFERVADES